MFLYSSVVTAIVNLNIHPGDSSPKQKSAYVPGVDRFTWAGLPESVVSKMSSHRRYIIYEINHNLNLHYILVLVSLGALGTTPSTAS